METPRKKRIVLLLAVGLPISLIALWCSGIAFVIAFKKPGTATLLLFLIGIAALWAVFTGLRNLWRFDTAHLHLQWHDWVGGCLGFVANSLLLYLCVHYLYDGIFSSLPMRNSGFPEVAYFYSALAAIVAFAIVLLRYLRHRFFGG